MVSRTEQVLTRVINQLSETQEITAYLLSWGSATKKSNKFQKIFLKALCHLPITLKYRGSEKVAAKTTTNPVLFNFV